MLKKAASGALGLGRFVSALFGLALVLGLVVGAGTTALAAVPGDPFELGKTNGINAISTLVGNLDGPMLRIENKGAGTALDLHVQPGKQPLKVDSRQRVSNLNSDKLDGKSANGLVRVASFTGQSPLQDGTDGTVARTQITAPAPGLLVIDAGSDMFNFNQNDGFQCFIKVDNSFAPGSGRFLRHNGASSADQEEDCSTNSVVPVDSGAHTIDLAVLGAASSTFYGDTALSAIYVPFGANGNPPPQGAITAAKAKGDFQASRTTGR